MKTYSNLRLFNKHANRIRTSLPASSSQIELVPTLFESELSSDQEQAQAQAQALSDSGSEQVIEDQGVIFDLVLPEPAGKPNFLMMLAIVLFTLKSSKTQSSVLCLLFRYLNKFNSRNPQLKIPADPRTALKLISKLRESMFPECFSRPDARLDSKLQVRVIDMSRIAAALLAERTLDPLAPLDAAPHFRSIACQPTRIDRAIALPYILFVDGYTRTRFTGKGMTAIYCSFIWPGGQIRPFDVAHLPNSFSNRLINQVVADIVRMHTELTYRFRGQLYELRLGAVYGDLPGRIGLAECPGMRSRVGGCPTCMATRLQMEDYSNRTLLEAMPQRTLPTDHPLRKFVARDHRFPVDTMHMLYLGLVKRMIKQMVKTREWWANQVGDKQERKLYLDEWAARLPFPKQYHLSSPPQLCGEQRNFTATDYKILAGTISATAPLLKPVFRKVWLALAAYIAAIETHVPPTQTIEQYWMLARACSNAQIKWFPNLHQALHAAYEQEDYGIVSVSDFERHNKTVRSELLASNNHHPDKMLIERAEAKFAIRYHFPTFHSIETFQKALREKERKTDGSPLAPTQQSDAVYFSSVLRCFTTSDGSPLSLKDDMGFGNYLKFWGVIHLVPDVLGSPDVDASDREQVFGTWKDGTFSFCPLTPGWQPQSLLLFFLEILATEDSSSEQGLIIPGN